MVSWAITGASRGLGLEYVRQLSQDKNNVIFALVRDVNSPELIKLGAKNVHILQGDLHSLPQLQEAAKTIASVTGSLDILINNGAYLDQATAALLPTQLTEPENLEAFTSAVRNSVESNVIGAVYVTNALLPLILQGNEKKIVHITTGAADTELTMKTENPTLLPYSGSKAMLNTVVSKYGVELYGRVHVVGISPGYVDTNPSPKEVVDMLTGMFRKAQPDAGLISPEESVRCQLDTIKKLSWEVQGRAISHHGDHNWF